MGTAATPRVVILGLASTSIDTMDRQVKIISSLYLLPSIRYLHSLRDQQNVTSKINDIQLEKNCKSQTARNAFTKMS